MYGSTLAILVIIVLAYILVGGAIFMELEKDEMDMTDIVNLYFKTHIRKYTSNCLLILVRTNPEVLKLFSCSTQPSTKFHLLIKISTLKNNYFFLLSYDQVVYLSCL